MAYENTLEYFISTLERIFEDNNYENGGFNSDSLSLNANPPIGVREYIERIDAYLIFRVKSEIEKISILTGALILIEKISKLSKNLEPSGKAKDIIIRNIHSRNLLPIIITAIHTMFVTTEALIKMDINRKKYIDKSINELDKEELMSIFGITAKMFRRYQKDFLKALLINVIVLL